MHSESNGTPSKASWPWQRSLQQRIVLMYGAIFFVVLALMMVLVGRIVYTAQLSDAEHNLELQAFLAANTLEDPLSGYNAEFEAFADWEESDEDHREGEHNDDGKDEDTESEDAEDRDAEDKRTASPPASPLITSPDLDRLQQLARTYAEDTGARITILDARGNPIVDSQLAATTLENQFAQPEVQTALRNEEQHAVRMDPVTNRLALFVAAPIEQSGALLGFVQMARPLTDITRGIWALILQLIGVGLLALGIATGLGYWIAHRIVRPVRTLETASLAVAAGDFGRRVPIESSDEVGALARAFNHMAQEVSRMMTQQRLFVANASHELRTPLTNIKLRSEALIGGIDDPDIAQRYLREIDGEADRLGRLATTLLDLSKLDAVSTAEGNRRADAVDLLAQVRAIGDAQRLRIEQSGLTFALELPASLPAVRIWPDHLESILINLLDNAVKFTPSGGTVSLAATTGEGVVHLHVRDTGEGIPAEDLSQVFERFYRVDKARSRRSMPSTLGSGAGLGLGIVKTLVTQNGGHIKVASTEGEGTCFTVSFPVA